MFDALSFLYRRIGQLIEVHRMASGRNMAIWVSIAAGMILLSGLGFARFHRLRRIPITAVGSVIKQDADTRKQSPIADVEISAPAELDVANAKSDFSGYFRIVLPSGTDPGKSILLHFSHPDYRPVDLNVAMDGQPNIIRMIPIHGEVEASLSSSGEVVSNVQVRYTTEITTTENIGAGIKTFQVVNTGGVPCSQHLPCSPDGKWKAAIDSASLDAGDGNVFQHARITCIAGPCPFTKVDKDNFSQTARTITVSVRNWSDTATFLVQAEVFHTQVRDIVRRAYPIIFGRSLNFTLPADAEGVTMEAELNGSQIIFPLAADPALSWTDCKIKIEKEQGRDYRCELKSGYRFP
jgi:hypothetical protein